MDPRDVAFSTALRMKLAGALAQILQHTSNFQGRVPASSAAWSAAIEEARLADVARTGGLENRLH